MTVPDFVTRMDWPLLREQKRQLTEMGEYLGAFSSISHTGAEDWPDTIEGLLALIDAVQDYADAVGLPAYPKNEDDQS